MKKIIIALALMIPSLIVYCQTAAQNEVAAAAKVEVARAALQTAEKELEVAREAMKKEALVQLKANDAIIAALRAKMVMPRRDPANNESRHQVDVLEDRNVELRNRLYDEH